MNAAVQSAGRKSQADRHSRQVLSFRAASQPKKAQADQRTPRQVIGEWLSQQIGLVEAEIAGNPSPSPKRVVQERRSGQVDEDHGRGQSSPFLLAGRNHVNFFCPLRYGNAIVNPVPNMTSVEAGRSLEMFAAHSIAVRKALCAGELDGAVQEAALAAKRRFASNKH